MVLLNLQMLPGEVAGIRNQPTKMPGVSLWQDVMIKWKSRSVVYLGQIPPVAPGHVHVNVGTKSHAAFPFHCHLTSFHQPL